MQFCRKFCFFAITRFLGEHFWPKFGGGGHKNILVDRVLACPTWICVMWSIWMSPFILNICVRPWHYSVHYVRTFAPVLIGTLKSERKSQYDLNVVQKWSILNRRLKGQGKGRAFLALLLSFLMIYLLCYGKEAKKRLSHVSEWQKLLEPRSPKSLDSTANFKPEKRYFVLILIFVAIYAFYKIFIMF